MLMNTDVNITPTAIRLICSAKVTLVVSGRESAMTKALAEAAKIDPTPMPNRASRSSDLIRNASRPSTTDSSEIQNALNSGP